MQVTANGRVRRGPAERREVLARWEQSGLTPAHFCRREQIQLSSFLRWRRRGRVAVTTNGFVELQAPPSAPICWALEIMLPNGCQLRFQG